MTPFSFLNGDRVPVFRSQSKNMRTRQQWENIEKEILAPYAQKASESRGRKYPESEHPFRSAYQRDRDRIIHSRAFRRLEYKTQVFVNHEGDHYRTRLTHSMEAANIARTIARALRLNEDLAETIALAHDLGHPPFGHSGQSGLNKAMKDAGGFEHNKQSLRVVEVLEKKYPQFPGLNLTWEVREGISKHRTSYDVKDADLLDLKSSPCLEAQLVDKADEIAYNCHDMDDGLASGLITETQLEKVELWKEAFEELQSQFHRTTDPEVIRYYTVRSVINHLVSDFVTVTEANIKTGKVQSAAEVRKRPKILVGFSQETKQKHLQLKHFLHQNLYTHPKVMKMNRLAVRIVQDLFHHYLKNPDVLNLSTKSKTQHTPIARVICDYIAGMTDRFAMEEHRKIQI